MYNHPYQGAVRDYLCYKTAFKVPFIMKFDPEVVQMCSKLSGLAASYSTREKFDAILHFLSKRFDICSVFPNLWLFKRSNESLTAQVTLSLTLEIEF